MQWGCAYVDEGAGPVREGAAEQCTQRPAPQLPSGRRGASSPVAAPGPRVPGPPALQPASSACEHHSASTRPCVCVQARGVHAAGRAGWQFGNRDNRVVVLAVRGFGGAGGACGGSDARSGRASGRGAVVAVSIAVLHAGRPPPPPSHPIPLHLELPVEEVGAHVAHPVAHVERVLRC